MSHCKPAALLALLAAAACDASAGGAPAPAPPRFEAVTVKKTPLAEELAGFCDAQPGGPLVLPGVAGLPPSRGGPRWVNVWATWCKSCIEELPMIERWRRQRSAEVIYLSADEDAEALARFRAEHPDLPLDAALEEPEKLAEWMQSLGLDAGAGLPLHLFVSSRGRLRCARAAAIAERHLPIVARLLD